MANLDDKGLGNVDKTVSAMGALKVNSAIEAVLAQDRMYNRLTSAEQIAKVASPLSARSLGLYEELGKNIASFSKHLASPTNTLRGASTIESVMHSLAESPAINAIREQEKMFKSLSGAVNNLEAISYIARGGTSFSVPRLLSDENFIYHLDRTFGVHRNRVTHFDLLESKYFKEEEPVVEVEKPETEQKQLSSTQIILLDNAPRIQSIISSVFKNNEELLNLNPRDFEKVVAELFRSEGLKVELTPQTRDGGRDIIAIHDIGITQLRYLVECKRWGMNRPVDVNVVRSFHSVLLTDRANKGFICTSSYITQDAHNYAGNHFPTLMDFKDGQHLLRWINQYMKQQRF